MLFKNIRAGRGVERSAIGVVSTALVAAEFS